jgi:hypothetical protein
LEKLGFNFLLQMRLNHAKNAPGIRSWGLSKHAPIHFRYGADVDGGRRCVGLNFSMEDYQGSLGRNR